MQTRPRVGYIDLLETQMKTEMNREGRVEAGGLWPLAPCQPRIRSLFWSFLPTAPFLWVPRGLLSEVTFPSTWGGTGKGGRAEEAGITHTRKRLGAGWTFQSSEVT